MIPTSPPMSRAKGSARVSRAADCVSRSRTFFVEFSPPRVTKFQEKIVSARRRNQHARRVRSPEISLRSVPWRDFTNIKVKPFWPRTDLKFRVDALHQMRTKLSE